MKYGRKNGPPPGLVNAIFLGCVYGYFALHMNKDPVNCYANDTDDQAIDENTAEQKQINDSTNIGAKFQLTFQILFFMTVIEAVISLFAHQIARIVHDKKSAEPVLQLAIFFYAMASLVEVILWLYLFAIRFSHAGQVCSGDFLSRKKASGQYVRMQGLFIKVVALLIIGAICCAVFLVPYLSKRQKKGMQQRNAQL